jgi:hypothetical protein
MVMDGRSALAGGAHSIESESNFRAGAMLRLNDFVSQSCYNSVSDGCQSEIWSHIGGFPPSRVPLGQQPRFEITVPKQYVGHLSSRDPLHPYLVHDVLPQMGVRNSPVDFRVFSMKYSKVYLY